MLHIPKQRSPRERAQPLSHDRVPTPFKLYTRSTWQPFSNYKPSLGDVLVRFYDGSLDVLPSRLIRYFVESGGLVEGFRLLPSALDDRWMLFTEGCPNEGAECLILRLSRVDVGRWTNGEFPNRGENAGFDSAWMTLTAAAAEVA